MCVDRKMLTSDVLPLAAVLQKSSCSSNMTQCASSSPSLHGKRDKSNLYNNVHWFNFENRENSFGRCYQMFRLSLACLSKIWLLSQPSWRQF